MALPKLPVHWLPPPAVVAAPLRYMPRPLQHAVLERSINWALTNVLHDEGFQCLQDRYLALEITDMQLCWVFTLRSGRLALCAHPPRIDATISGDAADLMLLVGRKEDPDTLFFQRRLMMQGDTELGLLVRNLLDRLDWEDLPRGVPVVLEHMGELAQQLRSA